MSTAPNAHAHPPTTADTWPARIAAAVADIKLAHTVFAMPFAILGAAMAITAPTASLTPADVAILTTLVIIAMVAARTWAMLVNRLADHRFDAQNPRTAKRAVASGRLSPAHGWTIAAASAAAFIATTAAFLLIFNNPYPLTLALPVLAWIALYSYTKRFTSLAHFFLGSALAISPLCAAIATNPAVFTPAWSPNATALACLALFVALWVAGFDIAYALQDIDHDRHLNLNSIPSKLGPTNALWLARATHTLALAALAAFALLGPRFGPITLAATAAVAALLLYEHLVLHKRGVQGLPIAFFTVNGIISCLLATAATIDLLA